MSKRGDNQIKQLQPLRDCFYNKTLTSTHTNWQQTCSHPAGSGRYCTLYVIQLYSHKVVSKEKRETNRRMGGWVGGLI